ncbi:MAG TPA: YtxH domain-containing protein [Candidatus Sulfotelmatobacter sp.]|nr:YtxH domain-containing protein [Candidatus Sulfotelmatobacter sp.]
MRIGSFLLGFGIGIGLGVILAPARGEETRHSVAQKARDLIEMPQRKIQQKVEQAAESAKETAGDVGERVGRQAAEAAVDAVEKNVLGKNRPA